MLSFREYYMEAENTMFTALVCNSNMFVPLVLTEILTHEDKDFLVLSDIDNLVRFFKEIQLPNVKVIKYHHATWKTVSPRKRELLDSTVGFNISRIIFFHSEYGGIINWYLQIMAKNTDIYYCEVYGIQPLQRAYSFRAFKDWLREYLFYGVIVRMLENEPKPDPVLPPSFYKKIDAKPYKIKVNYELINQVLLDKYPQFRYNAKILILTGSTVVERYVEEDEYRKKMNALIEAIGPQKCVEKCHPRFDDLYGLEKELPAVPSYIPGNLVIGQFDVFIGNHSTLLVEAAIAGKVAISLVDYLKHIHEDHIKLIKDFYTERLQGKGIIYFPKTIEDILSIIRLENRQ